MRLRRRMFALRFWFAASVLLALAGCERSAARDQQPLTAAKPDLAHYGAVPAFELRDQRGKLVRESDLRGRVLIVDFIFTSCPDVCPLLTQQLAGIREKLGPGPALAFVSFSVDPEHDTPEKLAAFADVHRANQGDWYFLTGPLDAVRDVVQRGFKQAMDLEPPAEGKPRNVFHGTHFVLVDPQGEIRGFFRSNAEGIAALNDATRALLGRSTSG